MRVSRFKMLRFWGEAPRVEGVVSLEFKAFESRALGFWLVARPFRSSGFGVQ